MNYFMNSLHACNICILIHCVTAYVLFAANLDDFKSIAKKFIPAKLADQLAAMASPTSVKYLNKAVEGKEEKFSENEEVEHSVVVSNEKRNTKSIKRFSIESQSKDINIDEIVEKIRIKLEKDYKNIRNTPTIDFTVKKHIDNLPSFKHKQIPSKKMKKETVYDNQPSSNEYEQTTDDEERISEDSQEEVGLPSKEGILEQPEATESEGLFKEIDMKKSNDSYEDYMTPKKDQIFESDEAGKSRVTLTVKHTYNPEKKQNVARYVDKMQWKAKERVTIPDYNEEVKAKTENLAFYDERETVYVNRSTDGSKSNSADAVENNQPIDGGVHKIKKPKGTMIPTRGIYKMSSPNYYAKLPIVAEKYNFEEPIPEKDREPENLKYIGNPPASINRKVKL